MNPLPEIYEVSLSELATRLAERQITSEGLVEACLHRIADIDPRLRSVLSLSPYALDEARASDKRRARKQSLGVLDGLPLLIKDNIDAAGLATTAGSLALTRNIPAFDAPVVRSLRHAGMVIMGKANLSEWSNFRSNNSTSGWSAVGGLTRNPYDLTRSACGSSSGSAVAVAASLTPAAIGTETDGSVVWPAAICGVVGMKPTKGLISQTGIIPISHEQDTPGSLTRDTRDAAMLLSAMCEPGTYDTVRLDPRALKGTRLGALRNLPKYSDDTLNIFESALETLSGCGATVIDVDAIDIAALTGDLLPLLLAEFKVGINAYLASANAAVKTRTLAGLIAFNGSEPRELEWFGQEYFELAEQTSGIDTPAYLEKRAAIRELAGARGIDLLMKKNNVAALVAPTNDPAWPIALGKGDAFGGSVSTLPAAAGYPHLTVPAGYAGHLPVGLSFIGPAWADGLLLSLGFAFEQAHPIRRAPPL